MAILCFVSFPLLDVSKGTRRVVERIRGIGIKSSSSIVHEYDPYRHLHVQPAVRTAPAWQQPRPQPPPRSTSFGGEPDKDQHLPFSRNCTLPRLSTGETFRIFLSVCDEKSILQPSWVASVSSGHSELRGKGVALPGRNTGPDPDADRTESTGAGRGGTPVGRTADAAAASI